MPNNHKNHLKARLGTAAFAFRGYNTTNLGRTPELLEHPAYGPVVAAVLKAGSEIASETLGRRVDLGERVRERRETQDLSSYAEDVALIISVEIAQMDLLERFFGVTLKEAKLAMGYSLGEAGALISAGVFAMPDLLRPPLILAEDCVALADGVTMGILFSRGPVLDYTIVERVCLEITQRGKGTIAISTYLSPNTILLMGQGETLDSFKTAMQVVLPDQVYLRKNHHRWPPLHTPITWLRSIPNRAAVLLQAAPGGFSAPVLPMLSCVTGKASYQDHNSRELLHRWVDHPVRLWNMVYETLSAGVETVVHVGPEPNLIPATFKRLSDNVKGQLASRSLSGIGLRAVSHMVRRRWLAQLLPTRTALLRAPFVEQIHLEDWLLEQKVP